jgi:DNA-binding response OmpR family regulator
MMAQAMRALVVDDEDGPREYFAETLRRDGYEVHEASSGEEALDQLRDSPFELVLLDLRLGGRIDGLRILEAARWRWPSTAIVIVTAHGSLESAMAAIREGVDGYLVKPVEPAQLRQALREAIERRGVACRVQQQIEQATVLSHGPFSVDVKKHLAMKGTEILELTPQEFGLLTHLMRNADRTVPAKELVEVVRDYTPEYEYEARQIIKWYIHRLRRKLEPDPGAPRYILNVRGVGYRLGP